METKKQIAINLIKDEIDKNGVITRKKAMSLYMKTTNQNMLNSSIVCSVTHAIAFLIEQNYMKTVERGMYIKI